MEQGFHARNIQMFRNGLFIACSFFDKMEPSGMIIHDRNQ